MFIMIFREGTSMKEIERRITEKRKRTVNRMVQNGVRKEHFAFYYNQFKFVVLWRVAMFVLFGKTYDDTANVPGLFTYNQPRW